MGLFDRLFGRKKQEPPIEEVVKEALETLTSVKKKQHLLQKQEKILKRKLFSPIRASSNLMTKFRIQKIVWLMLKS